MFNLPIYSENKLLLGFEYGVVLSDVAKEKNIPLTAEIVGRMEEIIKKEFRKKNPTRLSVDMIVNILASLEPKEL